MFKGRVSLEHLFLLFPLWYFFANAFSNMDWIRVGICTVVKVRVVNDIMEKKVYPKIN